MLSKVAASHVIPSHVIPKAIVRKAAPAAASCLQSRAEGRSRMFQWTPHRMATTRVSQLGNPLDVLRNSAEQRMLCNHDGVRNPGKYWTFQVALPRKDVVGSGGSSGIKISLRNVNFQRVTPNGVDFVMKRPDDPEAMSHGSQIAMGSNPPVSILYTAGAYKPGEKVEQWRAEGHYTQPVGLLDEILPIIPHDSIVGMLASKRASRDLHMIDPIIDDDIETEAHRIKIDKHAKFTELVQQTRIEFENGNVTPEEIQDSILAMRFVPERMERMVGSPDHVVWDRLEWVRDGGEGEGEGWGEARHLLPF